VKSVEVFEIAVREFNLHSLSEEDLVKARSILSEKLSEANRILNSRKQMRIRHPLPNDKETK